MDFTKDILDTIPVACYHLDREGLVNYTNQYAVDLFGISGKQALGKEITKVLSELNSSSCLNTISLAQKGKGKHTCDYISLITNHWIRLTAMSAENGTILCFTDIHDLKTPQLADDQYRLFVMASSSLVYRMSADWTQMYHLDGNNVLTDTKKVTSNWTDIYIPTGTEKLVWDQVRHAIEHRCIFELEHQVIQADGSIGWLHSKAIPVFDISGELIEWFGAGNDITPRKNLELALHEYEINYRMHLEQEVADRTQQVHEHYSLLQTIYDTSLIGMSVFSPVRNEKNMIIDFRIISVNKKIEMAVPYTQMEGKLYAELFPGIKEMGLFDLMVKTMETGEPGKMEYHYDHEGIDRWYSTMFVKGEDLLVSTNLDITERIQSEQERLRNYLLLQQSEALAQAGSWDYDLHTGIFTLSDGMYRLFDLLPGEDVQPEFYLEYASPESYLIAQRIVQHLRNADQDFEEIMEISFGQQRKLLQIKAIVIKDAQGRAARVLGVDMDITAIKAAEHRLLQMESHQQQEIFQVTLNTQEQERRRISESLHNGLGQLLYGIKLSLNYLTLKLALDKPENYVFSKNNTEGMLIDAIKETRKISHELMPTVLADFGLTAAIKEVCEQLQNLVQFHCSVSIEAKLDNYIELAVFRTVQELMINVSKHAKATHAQVMVSANKKEVVIQVNDNGQGMEENSLQKSGIGISSIRNKVDLLKGSFSIASRPNGGTAVEVRFPIY